MFWDIFSEKCAEINKTPSKVCSELGIGNSAATYWKRGATPHASTLKKIAKYFGVPESELTHDSQDASLIPEPTAGLLMRIDEAKKSVIPAIPDAVIMPDNSMVLDCIPKAAKLRLRKTTEPEENDVVAGCLNNEIFVRRWHRKLSAVVLSAANPKYAPILTDLDELKKPDAGIYGVVEKVEFEI